MDSNAEKSWWIEVINLRTSTKQLLTAEYPCYTLYNELFFFPFYKTVPAQLLNTK